MICGRTPARPASSAVGEWRNEGSASASTERVVPTPEVQIETTRGALTNLIGLLVAGLSEAMVGSVRANVV
jgi:hypothetical protein